MKENAQEDFNTTVTNVRAGRDGDYEHNMAARSQSDKIRGKRTVRDVMVERTEGIDTVNAGVIIRALLT